MKLDLMYNNKKNIPKTECYICKTCYQLEHHRIAKHGPYTESNVVILCKHHHNRYHYLERNSYDLSHQQIMDKLINEWNARDMYC